ncbi:unnamed protein product [Prunus armeniaca]
MPWTMNLNCPVFHGGNDNPVDYLCLAELYFKYLKTPELNKVEIASLHLQVMRFHGCQACTSPTTACINGRTDRLYSTTLALAGDGAFSRSHCFVLWVRRPPSRLATA